MKMQKQCAEKQYLSQLVEDQLDGKQRMTLEAHIETCEVCQHTLDELSDGDDVARRVSVHLRNSRPISDTVLLNTMDQIRSTSLEADSSNAICLDDFAVDYLHPSDDSKTLGRLGPNEVSEVIGHGGMGIVLKGHDAKLNRIVAVKALSPVLALNSTARKRFLREAQAAAAISHPNIVTIHSVGEDRLPYLVMEYVDGPSLQQRLDAEGFLQLNQILRIGVQVAAGLTAAHAQGIVHRDIKPGNILLEKGVERVKLTDFGLARVVDDASVTRDGAVVGTPQFMSPEQARGEAVDQASDQFSLGSVLYTLATGRPPFRAGTSYGVMRKITDESPIPIRELNPEIPDWLCSIVDRLMAKEKDERFPSVSDVHELMESCLSHAQQPHTTALPEILRPSRIQRISPSLKFFAGVTTMITLATCLILAMGTPSQVQPKPDAEQETAPQNYTKQFVVPFKNPGEVGTLNVDIKRGSIYVTGYDGNDVIVELSVPNYTPTTKRGDDGLIELQPNTLDFDVETSNDQIKLDGNSYVYITNLTIKVPANTNLILDSYRDGEIHVKRVAGKFNVRSQHNDLRLEDVSGSARAWSYNGNVTASFATLSKGEPLYFESYNGSLDVKLPADTKANASYRSGSGKVMTDFAVAISDSLLQKRDGGKIEFDEYVRGTLNGGGPSLTLETEKGDIRLRRRMGSSIAR